jgi:tetratricopeptide (TPR) repeat protein
MRTVLGLWVVLLSAGSARADAEEHFTSGMKALAAKNYTTALTELEAALTAEPDSIRYGSEYRQAAIEAKEYDRCIKFFEKLVAGNPNASNAYLNYGFAYVDKIPAAGSITQVILANTALSHFTKSIELQPSWIAYYTRGNSYLYWPRIFGRASLGVADLEEAMKIQSQDKKRSYHVRVYISLGDGYWKMDDIERAQKIWQEGLANFPEDARLKARLSRQGDELKKYIDDVLDPNKRVNTNLHELWSDQ